MIAALLELASRRATDADIVRALYSPENKRIDTSGSSVISRIAMLWNVSSMTALPTMSTLYKKKYPAPIKNTATTK